VFEQAAEYVRRAGSGLTIGGLAAVAGWSEGKASGALTRALRAGLIVRERVRAERCAVTSRPRRRTRDGVEEPLYVRDGSRFVLYDAGGAAHARRSRFRSASTRRGCCRRRRIR
jgi:DNA-binding transcriptional regulator PaaX